MTGIYDKIRETRRNQECKKQWDRYYLAIEGADMLEGDSYTNRMTTIWEWHELEIARIWNEFTLKGITG